MLYKSFSIDLISVLYSQALGITWKLCDFKESGKKQRPLKASKIYKMFLHSLTGDTVLCVWGLQYKKIPKVFSVKSVLHDLQTVKSRPDPRGSQQPFVSLMSRVPGEIQIRNSLQGPKPYAAEAAYRHLDSKFPSNPHRLICSESNTLWVPWK